MTSLNIVLVAVENRTGCFPTIESFSLLFESTTRSDWEFRNGPWNPAHENPFSSGALEPGKDGVGDYTRTEWR
jgi:hypothetical protein